MAKHYTREQVRAALKKRLTGTQRELAAELKVPFQAINLALRGAPISTKILKQLGFERVEGLYAKVQK